MTGLSRTRSLQLARQHLQYGHFSERGGYVRYTQCPDCRERVQWERNALDTRSPAMGLREALAEHLREWCESAPSREQGR